MTVVPVLADLLAEAAQGRPPLPDHGPTIVPQPSSRDAGIIAFTGHNVIFADVPADWLRSRLTPGDLAAPLNPPFLRALERRMDRRVDNIDVLALAHPLDGPPSLPLNEITDHRTPRLDRARRFRDDVRAWTCPGGVLILGHGVAGRLEIAVEIDPAARGRGLGRALARTARHLSREPLWAQIAPGNAASIRAFLAAGFTPIGAEALLTANHG
ncbi:GNAT family N-acetyltransferase [Actinomadura roseirufa]|uniref:GNAT family N-acetyltransferase n=1 Tax=Actinomadura roseirufa TaxID=2094049 RepID=UPI001041BB92|nr:GNAT family N-acetyltransferase [Actinomadura roseirufa]